MNRPRDLSHDTSNPSEFRLDDLPEEALKPKRRKRQSKTSLQELERLASESKDTLRDYISNQLEKWTTEAY